MVNLTVEEQVEYSTLPNDSIILVKILEVNDILIGQGTDREWTKLDFKFKILEIQHVGDGSPIQQYDDLVGQEIFGGVSARLTTHPENKLRQWAEAIFGMELGVGFQLNTDQFLQRQVRAITGTYQKRGTTFWRHTVESLLANNQQFAAPQQQGFVTPPQQPVQQAPQQAGWNTPGQPQQPAPQQGQQQPWNPVFPQGAPQQPPGPGFQGQPQAPVQQAPQQTDPWAQAPGQAQQPNDPWANNGGDAGWDNAGF